MRADARVNRERILVAAEAVFGESGAGASTEEVARRADVGIATVFRHFPTKLDLVAATLTRHFEGLTERASALADVDDVGAALRELVTTMIDSGATKITLANVLTEAGEFPPAVRAASVALRRAAGVVLRRAQAAGAARADVSIDDLYFLIRGLSQASATQPVPRSTTRRAIEVVLAGLGADRTA
jgi:AcrR family transcriptional regulator